VGGGGQKEKVKEGKYGGCSLYSCMKIEQWKFVLSKGRGDKGKDGGGESN
jgi:hypothetical protein